MSNLFNQQVIKYKAMFNSYLHIINKCKKIIFLKMFIFLLKLTAIQLYYKKEGR